ncbi:MAG: FAD-dependent oxidoreductase [Firmicutes bacterium]|jgi:phytoene dehydrogenase-like protein|nr:FAD-dependent oxidoreductase [Bacillota bacterium]
MGKVVIIGAGIGGLMAGNLLARKGHQVTIFESHTTPGGYTAGFWRNGFYFESGTLSFEAFPASNRSTRRIMSSPPVIIKRPF